LYTRFTVAWPIEFAPGLGAKPVAELLGVGAQRCFPSGSNRNLCLVPTTSVSKECEKSVAGDVSGQILG
jgi:hypothetical protein